MTEQRSPNRPERATPLRRTVPPDRAAVPPSDGPEPLRTPVRRVRASAAPGGADVERYLRYLRGPTAFGA